MFNEERMSDDEKVFMMRQAYSLGQSHMKQKTIDLIKDHFSDHIGDAGTVIDELLSALKEL